MQQILDLMIRLEKLKRTVRTGWNKKFTSDSRFKTRSVPEAESVADHSWSLAMFAMIVAHALGLDTVRMVRMALVHDVAELITFDIVTATLEGEEKKRVLAEKNRLEDAAMREIFLPSGSFGESCYDAWLELENQATPEARVLKQLDKLEACIQALLYREQGHEVCPDEFFGHADSYMKDPEFISLMELLRERAASTLQCE